MVDRESPRTSDVENAAMDIESIINDMDPLLDSPVRAAATTPEGAAKDPAREDPPLAAGTAPPSTSTAPPPPSFFALTEENVTPGGEEVTASDAAGGKEETEENSRNWRHCNVVPSLLPAMEKEGFVMEGKWRYGEDDSEPSPKSRERVLLADTSPTYL